MSIVRGFKQYWWKRIYSLVIVTFVFETQIASAAENEVSKPGAADVDADTASDTSKVDDAAKEEAQEAFALGDAAFDVQDYQQALEHFRASYETVQSPNSRLMVARSLLELGRLDEAYDEYGGVVKDAERLDGYERTASTAIAERKALQNRLAWLTIDMGDVPEDAEVEIGGRERGTEILEGELIAVNPGKTLVIATTADGQEAHAEVHLAAGRKATARLELGETIQVGEAPPPEREPDTELEQQSQPTEETTTPPPPRGPGLMPAAVAATGVGVAGLGAFAAFGLMSKNRHASLQDDCIDGRCPPASQDDIDRGKQFQLFANIGLGVGIAGVATGALLFVFDSKRKNTPVTVDVGWKSVTIRGKF